MNVKNLIESGQIELYIAEAITKDEKRLIDELSVDYPEITEELKSVEDQWYNFAAAFTRNPRPQLRKRIIDRVVKEGGKIKLFEEDSNLSKEGNSDIKWWLTAAAVGLLIMVSALNFMFYLKWSESEIELSKLKQSVATDLYLDQQDSLTDNK